jgi:hypothetical protein
MLGGKCWINPQCGKNRILNDQQVWLNRNSERIPRSLLRGMRANYRSIKIPYGEDSLQLAAG